MFRYAGCLRLSTFNAIGILRCAQQVLEIQYKERMEVIVVTEKWLRPSKSMTLKLKHESNCLMQNKNDKRGYRGVSLLLDPLLQYRLLKKHAEPAFKFLEIAIVEIRIEGV